MCFLECRDTFSHPPCTLVQPSMQVVVGNSSDVPEFGISFLAHILGKFNFCNAHIFCLLKLFQSILLAARSFCPLIYPLKEQTWQLNEGTPLMCLHSLQIKPSPLPPSFASQTVIDCQPLMVCAILSINGLVVSLSYLCCQLFSLMNNDLSILYRFISKKTPA